MVKILYNADIYTLNPEMPRASAIAIDRGVILALGDDDLRTQFGAGAQTQNMGGAPLIPGLTDAHIHMQHYAQSLQYVDCEVDSLEKCLQRVAERAAVSAPGEWILGHGWNQNNWGLPNEGGFPTAAQLDAVAPQHPVYLTAKSLHAGWANSAALCAAKISAQTLNPEDGEFQRDPHGAPTGILLEGAMTLLARIIPEPSGDELAEMLLQAQAQLFAFGITGVHDFDRRACFDALQRLHQRDALKLRVVKNIPVEDLPYAVGLGLRWGFGDDRLRIGGVKAFGDGALGPRTAAMLQPYEGEAENRGMLLLDAEQIVEFGQQAVANGLPLTIHAIGDRTNHEVVDAFEALRKYEKSLAHSHPSPDLHPPSSLRHRIEHVQIIHPDDAPRLAELGIIASMQPIHATSDMYMADRNLGQRATNGYTWQDQLAYGTVLAFGSDAPVESPNPFWGLHAAVTRRRRDGSPGPDGWFPAQRISLIEALRAYTFGAAYAAGIEDRLGVLAPGYHADLLVLETNPFTCEADGLHEILPLSTMIAGEWVYSAK
jgi:predicted amidohydrolase YtcJ